MDLMIVVDLIVSRTGLTEEQLGIALLFTILLANITGRLIPDDSKGVMGAVRRVAKVLGLYASNRVSKGITVDSVIESVVSGPTITPVVKPAQKAKINRAVPSRVKD